MRNRIALTISLVLVAFSRPASAQSLDSVLVVERGNRSIALQMSSNPVIGYWARSTDHADLGLDVFLGGVFSEPFDRIAIEITPALKRYLTPNSLLVPYTYFGIPLGYARNHNDNADGPDTADHTYRVGGIVGFGFDWLPVRQVSIGGHVGFGASYYDGSTFGGRFDLGTHSSGVRVHLYF